MGSKVRVRPLNEEEVQHIKDALKSKDAFTVRRSQILLSSHEGQVVSQIARSLRIATQTVRNTCLGQNGTQNGAWPLQSL